MLRQKQVLISHTDKHRCSCRRRCAEDGESYKGVQHLLWVGRQLGKSSNEMFFTRKAITFVCLAVLISLHKMEATVADRYVLQYLTEAGYSMAASALQSETGLTSAATEGKALYNQLFM